MDFHPLSSPTISMRERRWAFGGSAVLRAALEGGTRASSLLISPKERKFAFEKTLKDVAMSPWNSRGQNDWYLTPLAGEQAEKAAVRASPPHPTGIWTNLCASQGHTWKLWKGPEIASPWKGPLDGQDIPNCLLRQLSNETIFNTWKWSRFLSRGGRKYSR